MRIKKKNTMRSPEQKQAIVIEFLNSKIPYRAFADMHNISKSVLSKWVTKYRKFGIEGLRSNTGKSKNPRKGNHYASLILKKNKSREEELELENIKLKIEVARLKKGYLVKGVGIRKEYVTIKDLNSKS